MENKELFQKYCADFCQDKLHFEPHDNEIFLRYVMAVSPRTWEQNQSVTSRLVSLHVNTHLCSLNPDKILFALRTINELQHATSLIAANREVMDNVPLESTNLGQLQSFVLDTLFTILANTISAGPQNSSELDEKLQKWCNVYYDLVSISTVCKLISEVKARFTS